MKYAKFGPQKDADGILHEAVWFDFDADRRTYDLNFRSAVLEFLNNYKLRHFETYYTQDQANDFCKYVPNMIEGLTIERVFLHDGDPSWEGQYYWNFFYNGKKIKSVVDSHCGRNNRTAIDFIDGFESGMKVIRKD